VNGWVLESIVFIIHGFEVSEHGEYGFGKNNMLVAFEMVENLLGRKILVSHLEGNHN